MKNQFTKGTINVKPSDFIFDFGEIVEVENRPESSECSVKGLVYGGGLMEHHMFGAVVIELSSTKAKAQTPIYYEHKQKAGFGTATITDRIEIEGKIIKGTPAGNEIAAFSAGKFPWEMSVGIRPKRVEKIPAGKSVTVNGRQFQGPLMVLKENRLRECSLCGLGVDDTTHASVFSEETNKEFSMEVFEMKNKENEKSQEELDQEAADKVAADKAAAEAKEKEEQEAADKKAIEQEDSDSAKFSEQIKGLEAKVLALETENKKLSDEKKVAKTTARMSQLGQFSEMNEAQKTIICELSDEAFDATMLIAKTKAVPKKSMLFTEVATGADKLQFDANDPQSIHAAANKFVEDQKKIGKNLTFGQAVGIITKKVS